MLQEYREEETRKIREQRRYEDLDEQEIIDRQLGLIESFSIKRRISNNHIKTQKDFQ
jgi:hypothetical protein